MSDAADDPKFVLGKVEALASAMRAVGAGRASFDGVSLDLTMPPMSEPRDPGPPSPPETREEAARRREAILFRSSGGKKRNLR